MKVRKMCWVVVLAVTGCAWRGYLEPADLQKHSDKKITISSKSRHALQGTFYMLQPERTDAQAFKAALPVVFNVLGSTEFRDEVRNFDGWLEAPADCQTLHGDTVLKAIDSASFKDLQLLANWVHKANAVTDAGPNGKHHGIVVKPDRLAHWNSECTARKALVVDTLAHELMHVPQTQQNTIRFIDNGVSDDTRSQLVSYRVGWIAACVYLVQHGKETDVHTCVNNWESQLSARINGDLCSAS